MGEIHIPLWLFAIILAVIVYVGWKILKFAMKILIVVLIALLTVFLLDYFHILSLIKSFLAGI